VHDINGANNLVAGFEIVIEKTRRRRLQ
jgi:hypothetical protein